MLVNGNEESLTEQDECNASGAGGDVEDRDDVHCSLDDSEDYIEQLSKRQAKMISPDFYYEYEELKSIAKIAEASGLPDNVVSLQYPYCNSVDYLL